MEYSECKVPVHRERKFMGFKNNRLLDGGQGEQNQGDRFFKDEGFWRGQHQNRINNEIDGWGKVDWQ